MRRAVWALWATALVRCGDSPTADLWPVDAGGDSNGDAAIEDGGADIECQIAELEADPDWRRVDEGVPVACYHKDAQCEYSANLNYDYRKRDASCGWAYWRCYVVNYELRDMRDCAGGENHICRDDDPPCDPGLICLGGGCFRCPSPSDCPGSLDQPCRDFGTECARGLRCEGGFCRE